MRMSRRKMLIGIGAVAAGSGAVIGTSSFTTLETERTISVNVAEESQALVGIDINNRFGDENNGIATFDLQSNILNDTGFNPKGETTLHAALSVTNNTGQSNDVMSVEMIYNSESLNVPTGQKPPSDNTSKQFYFKPFDSSEVPSNASPFEGLDYNGDASEIDNPSSVQTGKTTILDLVVNPKGNLSKDQQYSAKVTIVANLKDNS